MKKQLEVHYGIFDKERSENEEEESNKREEEKGEKNVHLKRRRGCSTCIPNQKN